MNLETGARVVEALNPAIGIANATGRVAQGAIQASYSGAPFTVRTARAVAQGDVKGAVAESIGMGVIPRAVDAVEGTTQVVGGVKDAVTSMCPLTKLVSIFLN